MDCDPGLSPEEAEAEQEKLWEKIESKRHILTKTINPSKLTAYLRQCRVIDEEDEDEILHSHLLTSRRTRASRLLDILRCRGKRGYQAFLDCLELYYAELYKLITGKEPTRSCSVLVVEEGYEGLTQFLMCEAVKVQKQLRDRDMEIHKLQSKCEEVQEANKQLGQQAQALRGFEERYHKLKEEFKVFNNQLNKLREDSYVLAMKHAQLHEEKNMVTMRNRDLQFENDQMRCKLAGMEEECLLARRLSSKLQEDMESMPSKQSISKLQLDNQQLRSTIQELQHFLQTKNNFPSMDKVFLDIMDHDRREALEERQALVEKIHNISLELQQAENLRDKLLREKEDLGLQFTLLTKECQMQKRRLETVLQQIEEVEKERDQAYKARDEVHSVNAQLLLDNSRYRREIWGMEEKYDRLQMELTRKEGEVSVLQYRLMERRSTSASLDLPDLCLTPGPTNSSPDSTGFAEEWSSAEPKKGRSLPASNLSRRNCVKRQEFPSVQMPEFPESESGEETPVMEVLWLDIENEENINRFSMIPFPPCKASLMRRVRDEELSSRFEFGPLRSSKDFGNSCPDQIQNLCLSFTAGSERNPLSPCSTLLASDSNSVRADTDRRTQSLSLSLPDLSNVNHERERALRELEGDAATILDNPEPEQRYKLLGLDKENKQRTTLPNCAGKRAFWTVHPCALPDPLQFQPSKAYRTLQSVRQDDERLNEDSFYIRVNLNILGQVDNCSLQVKCDEILHVLDTECHSGSEWLCARVDPVTKQDLEQGTIPSYNRAHQLLMVKIHALIGNFQKNGRTKKNHNKLKMLGGDRVRIVAARISGSPSGTCSPSFSFSLEAKNKKVTPYSLVQPISVHQRRPVLIMPTILAKPLIQRILQLPAASEFDIVQPEVLTEEELKTKMRFSFQRILNQDKYESITLEAIRDVIAKNKHGLLPLGVHTVKDLISKDIYTIIIHIKVSSKNIKKLRKLVPKSCSSDEEFLKLYRVEQKHLESVPCLSATVEPSTWGNVNELAKAVKQSILQEQTKLVWIEQN
ncbi:caspase recruitment domain-containing protein 11-like isoform X2 [Hemitrygon akajei]